MNGAGELSKSAASSRAAESGTPTSFHSPTPTTGKISVTGPAARRAASSNFTYARLQRGRDWPTALQRAADVHTHVSPRRHRNYITVIVKSGILRIRDD